MAKLKNFNGRYCEQEFENAFISYLEEEEWQYLAGSSISRDSQRDVLYTDDLGLFLSKSNPDYTTDEITQIIDSVRLIGAESEFATLHKIYGILIDGIQFTPQSGNTEKVYLINYEDPGENIFRVVNQLTVEYTNNGQVENRRPDVLLYVNGIPLCIIELKNPADSRATVYDAWEQIYNRYWRDIPHLLHYCPLACISDGVKTRLGTVRTPYEHFYAWRRVNDGDKVSSLPFDEMQAMIKGVYSPKRFLEIFRDYIYFQDSKFDNKEREIVCRYPQFFAARLLKQSIIKSVKEKSGKGGTYFGATGCGKTYTMAFLSRQLAMRCTHVPEIGSPTIVMIVDREELQKQGVELFEKSTEFLNLGEVSKVTSRKMLREELGLRNSGGFYICTIQKFCDREDDKIGLINERANIICFSDEAHRTQLEHSKKIQFSKDADDNMKAMISKPYAKVLREAFPNATFVGFTGTPIAETYQTFGDEIDRYTMDQAVADGLTVPIKYHPRIAKVLLDEEKVKQIEDYYRRCADEGATKEDIEASKKAMSSMERILDEPQRLERLAVDIHDHYVAACATDPDRIQKAMVVCSNRQIAYLYLLVYHSNKLLEAEKINTEQMEENIKKWLDNNLCDLSISKVMKAIGQAPGINEAVKKYKLQQYFKKIGDRLNNYVHSNGVYYYNRNINSYKDNEFIKRLQLLVDDMRFITVTFLFLLTICSPLAIMSTDYTDFLDMRETPPEGSQYWVAPFVTDFFKSNLDLIDKSCIEYLKENTFMDFD